MKSSNNIDLTESSATAQSVGLGDVENHPMDSTPTDSSGNYVTSGGVYTAISEAFETNITSAISHTYNELKTLVDTNSLKPNQWYCITDYATKNSSHWNSINLATIEPLYIRARQVDKFDSIVYSQLYPKDIIKYDFTDNVLTAIGDGEWEDGADNGGTITCSNFTTSTLDVNKELIIDSDFYMSAEDDEGDVEYNAGGLGTDFTITDLGGGNTRITDLTGDINFAHPDYNFGEINSTYKIADTTGKIYYREDPVKHIECRFDFRGARYARKRIDVTAIPTWVAGAYTYKDLVVHNGYIYRCMLDTTEATNTNYWIKVASHLDMSYLWVDTWSEIGITLDSNHMMIPVFSIWDGNAFIYSDVNISDVTVKSEDVVFPRINTNIRVNSTYVAENASQLSFGGTMQNMMISRYTFNSVFDFNTSSQSIEIQDGIKNSVVSGSLRNSKITSISYSVVGQIKSSTIGELRNSDARYTEKSTVGFNFSRVRWGTLQNTMLGNNGSNSFFYSSYYNKIGNSFNNIITTANSFSNNSIGDLWRGFNINNTFSYNTIGIVVGTLSHSLTLDHSWFGNSIGSYCFQASSGTSFGGHVQNMTIGNSVDRLSFSGTASNSSIGNGCSNISCSDFFNVELAPYCRFFEFNGNIQQCSFKSGVRNLTFLSPSVFKNNHVRSDHITFDPANTVITSNTICDVYKTSDGDARMSFIDDNDHHRLIDPTDSSEVLKYNLPLDDGTAGQVLSTDGAGNITWATP